MSQRHASSISHRSTVDPKTRVLGLSLALILAVSGATKLVGVDAWLELFAVFGYPSTFVAVVGALELLGALLLVPRIGRELGAAIAAFVFAGAALSHLVNGGFVWALIPLSLFVASAWLMWRSRDEGPNSHAPTSAVRSSDAGSYPVTQMHRDKTIGQRV